MQPEAGVGEPLSGASSRSSVLQACRWRELGDPRRPLPSKGRRPDSGGKTSAGAGPGPQVRGALGAQPPAGSFPVSGSALSSTPPPHVTPLPPPPDGPGQALPAATSRRREPVVHSALSRCCLVTRLSPAAAFQGPLRTKEAHTWRRCAGGRRTAMGLGVYAEGCPCSAGPGHWRAGGGGEGGAIPCGNDYSYVRTKYARAEPSLAGLYVH